MFQKMSETIWQNIEGGEAGTEDLLPKTHVVYN